MWKHGFPRSHIELQSPKTLKVFIVRDLKKWLTSMYDRPYYLLKTWNNFKEFLATKHKSNVGIETAKVINVFNGKELNYTDINKNIFEIRYQKLRSYFEFTKTHDNCVFVKLEYIQNKDNCKNFIKALNIKYDLGLDPNNIVSEIPYHCTQNVAQVKNFKHSHEITEEEHTIIDQNKKSEIEKWVDNLTFEMI